MKIPFFLSKIAVMKKLTYLLAISILMTNCDDENCYIQDVYVNERIDLSLPIYSEIFTPGNSIFIEGGAEGIIIYHGTGDGYKVYDRSCSYEPCLSCSYIDSVSSGIAYCGCCPSAFSLYSEGAVLNAPALLTLKAYNWSLDNNILKIFN